MRNHGKGTFKKIIMRRTTLVLSAFIMGGSVSPLSAVSAEEVTVTDQNDLPLPAPTTSKGTTTVSRKSKDPVNIPISSGRFRPFVNEGLSNNPWGIEALYKDGHFVVKCEPPQGEARILVKTPKDRVGRLYRLSTKARVCVPTGDHPGTYHIEVKTSVDNYYIFEFELTD